MNVSEARELTKQTRPPSSLDICAVALRAVKAAALINRQFTYITTPTDADSSIYVVNYLKNLGYKVYENQVATDSGSFIKIDWSVQPTKLNSDSILQARKLLADNDVTLQAHKLFEKWKAHYIKMSPHSKVTIYKQWTRQELEDLPITTAMSLLYTVMKRGHTLDRHEMHRQVQALSCRPIGQSTISGRLGDLINAGILYKVGNHVGAFGKKISVYSIERA